MVQSNYLRAKFITAVPFFAVLARPAPEADGIDLLNTPFQFTRPGYRITETAPWEENGQTWRRLRVTWPRGIHTHSREQALYIDREGLIRRLDYRVEVAGNVAAAHYLSEYRTASGITMATKRVVYLRGQDNKPRLDAPVVVAIDFKNIQLQ